MQVAFYLAGEITQVIDSIPWVRCASGNVVLEVLESVAICILLLALTLVAFAHKIHILPGTYLVHIVPGIPYLVCILPGIPYLVAGTYIIPGTYHQREGFLRLHSCRRPSRSTNPVPAKNSNTNAGTTTGTHTNTNRCR